MVYRGLDGVRVRGDSMIDEGILNGDLLICLRAIEAHNGQKVIALVDGQESTVKRFHRKGRQVVLAPANPRFKDIVLDAERVEIQGIVIGLQRRTI